MKTTKLFLAAMAFAGCAKANDVSRMEDDAIATVGSYQLPLHELETRANELLKVPLAPDAASRLRDAKVEIAHLKGEIAGTNRIELDKLATDAELVQKKLDNVEHDLQDGILVATDHLEAVESWISVAERTNPPRTP